MATGENCKRHFGLFDDGLGQSWFCGLIETILHLHTHTLYFALG